MNKIYDKIKSYYDSGLWSEVRVRNMVVKGIITEEEYTSIVGKEYEEQILLADLLATYGSEIITTTNRVFAKLRAFSSNK